MGRELTESHDTVFVFVVFARHFSAVLFFFFLLKNFRSNVSISSCSLTSLRTKQSDFVPRCFYGGFYKMTLADLSIIALLSPPC